jgi:thiol:disulfide interchange protein DsbA|tara:strand:- start:1250 stop:1891 length:642 start_codon:yes stop_codon:yes gene_type:complete
MDYMNKYYKNFMLCVVGYALIAFTGNIQADYKLGKDYRLIDNPLPVRQDGMVEVSEIFWYGCNHCYNFESTINNWDKNKPDYVKFSKMPITWSKIHQLHAALYHTIEALKLDEGSHTAVFTTIHKENNFLASEKAVVKFLSKLGVEEDKSKQYLNSFAVKQKVSRGIQVSRQLKITSVPMIVVDGKYIIESKPSRQEMLEVLDYVVEMQKSSS